MFTSRGYIASGLASVALSLLSTTANGAPYTGIFSGTISSYYFTSPDIERFVGTPVTGWFAFNIDDATGMTVGSVTPYGIESFARRETGCSLHIDGSCVSSQGSGPRFLTYNIHTRFGDFGPLPQSLDLYESAAVRVGQISPNSFHENGSQYYFADLDQRGSFQVTTPDADADYLVTELNRYLGVALSSENYLLLPTGPLDLFQTPNFSAASPGVPPITVFDNSFFGSCVREGALSRTCSGLSADTRFFVDLTALQIVAGDARIPEPSTFALVAAGLLALLATLRRKGS